MQGKSELSNQKMSLMIEIAKIRKNINQTDLKNHLMSKYA